MALVSYITPTFPAGSNAGITAYRHGPAQSCIRSRSRPTKVKSDANRLTRGSIGTLSMLWELLTDAQRIGWGAYAFATPLLDAYSAPRYIKGYAHYMRSNRPRLQFGEDRIDDPPTTDGTPDFTPPTLAITTDLAYVAITWNTDDDWVSDFDGLMYLWISRPVPTAQNFPPEAYRPFWEITRHTRKRFGSDTIDNPYATRPSPTRIFIRASVQLGDGRLSSWRYT